MSEFGPPDVLVPAQVADPAAGPGQVLVDVEIANVTFVETQIRAGRAPHPSMLPRLPAILGNGVGGVVSSAGAARELAGTRVITTTGGSGGYAERVAVDPAWLIRVPPEQDLADAVALLADGRTAVALMRAAAVRAGETVLVEAAAGGVGSLLVQLARNAGADVIAAARGQRKLAVAAALGALATVDYTEPGWADQVRATSGGVDVVFDGVGGPTGLTAFGLLRRGGRFCAFGMASGTFAPIAEGAAVTPAGAGVTVMRGAPVSPGQMSELTRSALAEAAAGRLRPVIGQTFPLGRAADAHAAIESRATVGKTLLLAPAYRTGPISVPDSSA